MGSVAPGAPALNAASLCCAVAGWESAPIKPRTKMKIAIEAAGTNIVCLFITSPLFPRFDCILFSKSHISYTVQIGYALRR